jgi:hypothetical protein
MFQSSNVSIILQRVTYSFSVWGTIFQISTKFNFNFIYTTGYIGLIYTRKLLVHHLLSPGECKISILK